MSVTTKSTIQDDPLDCLFHGSHRIDYFDSKKALYYNFDTLSRRWDLNPQPQDYKSSALPIELRRHCGQRKGYPLPADHGAGRIPYSSE